METELIQSIQKLNPWLSDPNIPILPQDHYIHRHQESVLTLKEWDRFWLILVGPRQAGKTTLGKHLCQQWIRQKRCNSLLYLNCDLEVIRRWFKHIYCIDELLEQFALKNAIFFIDEVQRLENAGLLMKAIVDLGLPYKFLASGSSQLEIKSKVQEALTGRHFETNILPLSTTEIGDLATEEEQILYGCYPQIVKTNQKRLLLNQLYSDYINKDIIEILKISKPDTMTQLLSLIAHSSGQLVNYQQLAIDCRVSIPTIQHYLGILEKTYVIKSIRSFVGNKRQELTSNPIYYFIDNGFRNQSLNNFSLLKNRTDTGLLIQNFVFQELYKFKIQNFKDFEIYYWRTKGGAEIDFILRVKHSNIIPLEVKYRNLTQAKISRGFRSFIDAYNPTNAFIITKNLSTKVVVNKTPVHFVPFNKLNELLKNMFISL